MAEGFHAVSLVFMLLSCSYLLVFLQHAHGWEVLVFGVSLLSFCRLGLTLTLASSFHIAHATLGDLLLSATLAM